MSYIGAKPAEQILSSADIQDGSIATADLADASITQAKLASGVAGSGPAFFAYLTADQSITSSTYTKIAYDAEAFDTNNNFASSRFTPTVAGYYQISAGFDDTNSTAAVVRAVLTVYKNGSQFIHLADFATGTAYTITGSTLVYCNGTTDYIEIYGFLNATGPKFTGQVSSIYYTWMSGVMVRGA